MIKKIINVKKSLEKNVTRIKKIKKIIKSIIGIVTLGLTIYLKAEPQIKKILEKDKEKAPNLR